MIISLSITAVDAINTIISINVILNCILALLLIFKKGKFTSHNWFISFTIAITLWCLSMIFYRLSDSASSVIWSKNLYASASLIPSLFLLFAISFPDIKLSKKVISAIIGLNVCMILIIYFPDLFITGVTIPVTGEKIIKWGELYPLFVIYTPALFMLSYLVQFRKLKKLNNILKLQMVLILTGSLTTSSLAMISNLILPTFSIFTLNWFGQISTSIWLILTGYAILRYKLLDIRLIFGKLFYYLLLSLPPYLIFNLLVIFYETLFGTSVTPFTLVIGVPISVGFVVFFNSFKNYLQNYTDTNLINPGYNPLEVTARFNAEISSLLDIKAITNNALSVIQKTIRPDYAGILVVTNLEPFESRSFAYKDQALIEGEDLHFIIDFWSNLNLEPLVYEELDYDIQNKYRQAPHLIEEVKRIMEAKKLRAFIPFLKENKLAGMFLLGAKEADSNYSSMDIKFLMNIASSITLSLDRALLYDQSLQFTKTLEKKVLEATVELEDKNTTLKDALIKLEESRRQERDMIDVMGHELRTPLSIVRNALIVLNTDFKKDRVIETDKLERYLKMGIESIRREVTLVETLLSATKFEGKRIQLQLSKVDLADVVNDSIEAHKYRAVEKNLVINYTPPENPIEVYADRVRTQEIMDNFLSNAIKYTAKGDVTITVTNNGNYNRISLADTGIGIATDDLVNLGKKFFRAKKIFGEKDLFVHPSGTGLGLYVTFQLIDVMGGHRIITSVVGKGSTFAFELPVYKGQEDKMIDQTFMDDKSNDELREASQKEEEVLPPTEEKLLTTTEVSFTNAPQSITEASEQQPTPSETPILPVENQAPTNPTTQTS